MTSPRQGPPRAAPADDSGRLYAPAAAGAGRARRRSGRRARRHRPARCGIGRTGRARRAVAMGAARAQCDRDRRRSGHRAAFGLLLKPTVHGFLGYATLTARDIREALAVTQRYFRMRNRQYRLTYAEDERGATLELHGVQASPVLQHHVMFEFVLTGPRRTFRNGPDASRRRSSCNSRGRSRLISRAIAINCHRSNSAAPPTRCGSRATCSTGRCRSPTKSRTGRRSCRWSANTRRCVRRKAISSNACARSWHAGPAITRDRRRSPTRCSCRPARCGAGEDAGSSYRQLLDEARFRDAKQLLTASDLDLKTIAERLQFTDPANFTRAFRRWAGQTPSAYREAAAGLTGQKPDSAR